MTGYPPPLSSSPRTSDLAPYPPAIDIWWWSLETYSNLFIGAPETVSGGGNWNWSLYGFQAGSMHPTEMLSCLLLLLFWSKIFNWLVSTYVVCERLSVMQKQVSVWTVNFCPNSPEHPSLEFQIRVPPSPKWRLQISVDQVWIRVAPPKMKTSDLSWPKFRSEYPPSPNEDFRFELTKVQIRVPPPPTPPSVPGGSFCMWRLIFIIQIIF